MRFVPAADDLPAGRVPARDGGFRLHVTGVAERRHRPLLQSRVDDGDEVRVLEGNVPPAVLTRPKQGFAIPLAEWLREGWRDTAYAMLLDGPLSRYFRREAIETMLDEHGGGRIDHSERLWLLLVFAAWHARYLGSR